MNFRKLTELRELCSIPVWIYSIPSFQIFELLPKLDIESNTPNYDRWETTISTITSTFGNRFYIDRENVFQLSSLKTLAEIYYILHIDKRINGVINIRNTENYFSVQPGVKRIIMLKHMNLHNVQYVCFNKKIPNADKYLIKAFNKKFSYSEKEIGPEIQDPSWHDVFKKRLSKNSIQVDINTYEVKLDNILFLKKDVYKAPWKVAYK